MARQGYGSMKPGQRKKFHKVLREYKAGTLRHGSTGKVVRDVAVARAIAFSEARRAR